MYYPMKVHLLQDTEKIFCRFNNFIPRQCVFLMFIEIFIKGHTIYIFHYYVCSVVFLKKIEYMHNVRLFSEGCYQSCFFKKLAYSFPVELLCCCSCYV